MSERRRWPARIAGVVVGGLLGRVVMRISGFMAGPALAGVHTENGNVVGDITVAGTIALITFVGLPSGLLGGVLYALLEPWLRRLRPWHGLAYGVALLATAGFIFLDPVNFDFRRFGVPAVNVAMFAALFVLFGVATAWLFDKLRVLRAGTTARRRAPSTSSPGFRCCRQGLSSCCCLEAVLVSTRS